MKFSLWASILIEAFALKIFVQNVIPQLLNGSCVAEALAFTVIPILHNLFFFTILQT